LEREACDQGIWTWLPDGKNDEPLLEKKQQVAAVENASSWRVPHPAYPDEGRECP